ncbi:MAG: DUF4349 domain-containing protein [Clostridium sp.]|nr:DUF4349 domain-containing protein [Clostridium sp.]MCM1399083.1 DUF4349 domain-containing protein [Clostridium sp.]MCM1459475.1 DUF4349 domain-containing protein [Bacteroides sp.]
MKKRLFITLSMLLILTGCGNSKSDTSKNAMATEAAYDNGVAYDGDYEEEVMYEAADTSSDYLQSATMAEGGYGTNSADAVSGEQASAPADSKQTASDSNAGKVSKEMLVYRGDLSIDTLDFDKSVSDFKALINEKGGFVENESYTDSYSDSGYYYVERAEKHNIYSATVRVPSSEYDAVMNSANTFGDIRNRSSVVTNVTQEYGTYKSQLEIYEAEYARYLSLLEKATEDEYALMIENELFDIQIKIASLKSGISNIENDVAYSYIDIYIKEVSKYEEQPASTETFLDRFKNTCADSWENFLDFLERFLFGIIMNIYTIIIIAIIVIIVWRKLRKKKVARKAATQMTDVTPAQTTIAANNATPVQADATTIDSAPKDKNDTDITEQ